MPRYLPILSSILALTSSTLATSPVLPGLWADPNIAVFDQTYYLLPTQDGFESWSGQQFYIWSSSDLVTWTRTTDPILTLNGTSGNVPWSDGSAWAPTIAESNGNYYFYFSGNNPTYDRKTIGVAVSKGSPLGPYTAQPTAMINGTEEIVASQTIDPYAFLDPVSNRWWLFWGNGKALAARLSPDLLSIEQNTLVALSGTLTSFNEGSSIAYRDGVYHFNYAINDTRSEYYATGYATATNLTGPYTYQGPILQLNASLGILGTGGSTLLNVPETDDWYIAYHRFAIPDGNGTDRETTLDRVYFDAETGLIQKVVPTLTSVEPEVVPV